MAPSLLHRPPRPPPITEQLKGMYPSVHMPSLLVGAHAKAESGCGALIS